MWVSVPTISNNNTTVLGLVTTIYAISTLLLALGFLYHARNRARKMRGTIYAVTNLRAMIWAPPSDLFFGAQVTMTSCINRPDFPYAVSPMGKMQRLHIGTNFHALKDGKLTTHPVPNIDGHLRDYKTDLFFENVSNAEELREMILAHAPSAPA